MTTNIEQKFFNTFGIEPKIEKYCYWECKKPELKDVACESPCNFNKTNIFYPEITDHKLLEMICILNEIACEVLSAENIGDLKNEILETCIKVYNTPILTPDGDEYENTAIRDKIQQLFKEGE